MDTFVAACKDSAVWGMEHLLKVLSFVPDDKLDWSPSPTAKSALRVAAHAAVYAPVFAEMIRERKLPAVGDEIPAFVARMQAAEEAITDRTETDRVFRQGTQEVLAALDTLTPEDIAISLDSGMGWSMPMTFLIKLPGVHAAGHAAQIDYLQTCWGDQEVHF